MPESQKNAWIHVPVYPLLAAAYPTLYLFSRNVGYADPLDAVRPLLLTLGATVFAWMILAIVIRNRHRAAFATTVLLVVTFGYAVYSQDRIQLVTGLAGGAALLLGTALSRKDWIRVTPPMNVFSAALVAIAIFGIARGYAQSAEYAVEQHPLHQTTAESAQPDIYYIIVDAYARDDILQEFYDYDNSAFTDFLRQEGFFIHPNARANYPWTVLSLASSLNFIHATEIAQAFNLSGSSETPLWGTINNNRAMAFLLERGYETHAYLSGALRGNMVKAQHFYRPPGAPTEFENTLLNLTPIPKLLWKLPIPSIFDFHRKSLVDTVEAVKRAPEIPAPKFVFVHLLCPHPPFVFGPNGEPIQPPLNSFGLDDGSMLIDEYMTLEEYRELYRNQLIYLNQLLTSMVGELRRNDPDAVIVLQGDHGPASQTNWFSLETTNMKERFGVLNAVYLPGDHPELESAFKTPVNTFRLIFNTYFGTDFDTAPDDSHFVVFGHPYEFYRIVFPDDPEAAQGLPAQ